MTSQAVSDKADAYLTSGRVRITHAVLEDDGWHITASCLGSDTQPYEIHASAGSWRCSCPAHTTECAHIIAVRKVAPEHAATVTSFGHGNYPDLAAIFDDAANARDEWKDMII